MTQETELDRAHAALEAAPEDDSLRLAFYGRLVEGELFLLLEKEVEGDTIAPRIFPLDEGPFVLVFDTEERLAEFAAGPAPYAALPGGRVAQLLARQGIGLGLNLGDAPSSMLLPPEAVDWLAETLGPGPTESEAKIETVAPPEGVPDAVLTALDRALSRSHGLAQQAYLAGVRYGDGRSGHLVAFVDAEAGAETALAKSVEGALRFSGVDAGLLDVAFFRRTDPLAAPLARWGLRIDLPQPETGLEAQSAPGTDPDRPPRLK